MDRRRRSSSIAGVLLILLGAWFLAVQLVPQLQGWFEWPLIIVGVGAFLLIFGLAVGSPEMAVPACVVGGIGGLLYWQNATGNWETWAFAWTLIPGFVGVGILLAGLLGGQGQDLKGGVTMILISATMFLVFGSFFGALGLGPLGDYWPLLLVGLGLLILIRGLFRRR